jgi:hypothetical protein
MPGLYQRDNLAQQLAQAIELAQQRRERTRAIEDQRNSENVKAATDFAKALGRTYETWDDDEAKLAKLQKEREEVVAQQKYEQQVAQRNAVNDYLWKKPIEEKYDAQVAQRNAVGDYLFQKGLRAGANPYLREMNSTNAMAGYEPYPEVTVPNYMEALKKRGLY